MRLSFSRRAVSLRFLRSLRLCARVRRGLRFASDLSAHFAYFLRLRSALTGWARAHTRTAAVEARDRQSATAHWGRLRGQYAVNRWWRFVVSVCLSVSLSSSSTLVCLYLSVSLSVCLSVCLCLSRSVSVSTTLLISSHLFCLFLVLSPPTLRCVALRCVALRCVALRCVALRCVASSFTVACVSPGWVLPPCTTTAVFCAVCSAGGPPAPLFAFATNPIISLLLPTSPISSPLLSLSLFAPFLPPSSAPSPLLCAVCPITSPLPPRSPIKPFPLPRRTPPSSGRPLIGNALSRRHRPSPFPLIALLILLFLLLLCIAPPSRLRTRTRTRTSRPPSRLRIRTRTRTRRRPHSIRCLAPLPRPCRCLHPFATPFSPLHSHTRRSTTHVTRMTWMTDATHVTHVTWMTDVTHVTHVTHVTRMTDVTHVTHVTLMTPMADVTRMSRVLPCLPVA